jgi:hypothetical protein
MLLSRAFAASASDKRSLGAASASIGPGDHAAPEEARSRLRPAPSLLLREKRPVRSERWFSSRLSLKGRDAAGVVMPVEGSVSVGPLGAAVWLCGALFQAPVVASWWR